MSFTWRRGIFFAVLVFLILFAFHFTFGVGETTREGSFFADTQSFEGERKNYASAGKIVPGPTGQAIGDTQKYEKVATVTELTANYEADRKHVDDLIAAQQGIVQFER